MGRSADTQFREMKGLIIIRLIASSIPLVSLKKKKKEICDHNHASHFGDYPYRGFSLYVTYFCYMIECCMSSCIRGLFSYKGQ